MNLAYRNSLEKFLAKRWYAVLIVVLSVGLIWLIGSSMQSELAPLDDRGMMRIIATAPEGSSYEFTDRYMDKLSEYVEDSVPEKRMTLVITAPGFTGSGAVNTGFF